MDNDKLLVYQLDGDPIELEPEKCVFIDRTRSEEDCDRARYYGYEMDGFGYSNVTSNEDLVIGSGIHEFMDARLQGVPFENALIITADYMEEHLSYPDYFIEEQQMALTQDAIHLVRGFANAYEYAHLDDLTSRFEMINVEEEIPWVLDGPDFDGKYLIVMSRPDGTPQHRATDKLWHLSNKTTKEFNVMMAEKLQIDVQRYLESLAIQAKYGEQVEGTIYTYFLKGRKYHDKDLNIDRFSSPLIHPYMQRISPGGDISPEMITPNYEWKEVDGHQLKSRRLGTGWQRVSIYDEIPYDQYIQWLKEGLVLRSDDTLRDSILITESSFNLEHVERWIEGFKLKEWNWSKNVNILNEDPDEQSFNTLIPVNHSRCYNQYNRKCTFFSVCWEYQQIQHLVEAGKLQVRTPNHAIEEYKVTRQEEEVM